MYAKLKDFTCIKSLFVSYPKKFDTEYKWFNLLPVLADLEFETHEAYYVYEYGKPHLTIGNVTYRIANRTFTDKIQMIKNTWISVTEWQIENPLLDVLVEL